MAIFGALNLYYIRDVASMRLRRLEERYAEFDQVAFIGMSRHDGRLLDAAASADAGTGVTRSVVKLAMGASS